MNIWTILIVAYLITVVASVLHVYLEKILWNLVSHNVKEKASVNYTFLIPVVNLIYVLLFLSNLGFLIMIWVQIIFLRGKKLFTDLKKKMKSL